MSVDGGPEYPATTDLAEVATGGVALVDEPIAFDVEAIRGDFPILERTVDGAPLVYLDSANSSQKPRVVVEAIEDHYLNHNANVARAMHVLGAEATEAFEDSRAQLARFIGANRSEEVVFTKNASEALNLCAYTLGASIRPGDEIVISVMEHHSNIVPWQLLAQRSGAVLRWFDVTNQGRLDLDKAAAEGLINERTKIISVTYVSNVLGTVNPISQIAALGHAVGATVVVDASQAVPQLAVDFAALGADLVAFTGHKMVGPTGIGVLWGRYELLAALPPFLGGGEMIEIVTMARLDVRAASASLRGGYAAYCASSRSWRRCAVLERHRDGSDQRSRTRHHRVRVARAADTARPHDSRTGRSRGSWRRRLVHTRRPRRAADPPARREPPARLAGHCGAGRTSLRAAAA